MRQLRGLALTTLAVAIIGTAVLVGVGRALIPYADEVRPWLSDVLSQRLGQPVTIERVEAQWPRLTPQLTLYGLSVGQDDEPLLVVDQTRLELRLLNLLSAQRNPFQLIVLGLDLVLAEDADGQWGLELEGGAQVDDGSAREQLLAGDLMVRDARLRIRPVNLPEFGASLVEGDIRRRGEQTHLQGLLEPDRASGPGIRFGLLLEHPDGRWTRARAWAEADALEPAGWLATTWLPDDARVSMEAWLSWSDEAGVRLDLDFELIDSGLGQQRLGGEALVIRQQRQVMVELVSLWAGDNIDQPVVSGLAVARGQSSWALAIDRLDLAGLHALAGDQLEAFDFAPRQLSGHIHDLSLGWRPGSGLFALEGRVLGLGVHWPDPLPILDNLDLILGLDGDRVVLEPGGQPYVDWPALLRGDVTLDRIGGQLLLAADSIELRQVEIENEFLSGSAEGWIYRGEHRPFLDFVIEAERIEAIDPRPYLPPRYIPELAMDWLDQALGHVGRASGVVLLHMRAGKLASEIRPGDFQAHADFAGVDIDYWPEWPMARDLQGTASFVGSSLSAVVNQGLLGDLPVAADQLRIDDLNAAELSMELRALDGEAVAVAELLMTLPVPGWIDILEPMQWSGPVRIDTHLRLPFSDMDNWWIEGTATLDQTGMTLLPLGLILADMGGEVSFDRDHLGPATVLANVAGEPIRLDLQAGFSTPAWLELESALNPAILVSTDSPLATLASQMEGQADFRIGLSGAGEQGLQLTVGSDLEGLALDLPPPLEKQAEQSWPLALDVRIGAGDFRGTLDLAEWLTTEWLVRAEDWRLAMGFSGAAVELPERTGMRVRGRLDQLAIGDWLGLVDLPPAAADQVLPEADIALDLGQLDVFGLGLSDISVVVERDDLAWQIALAGSAVDGHLTIPVPLDSGRVVVADLRRLHLDSVEPEPELEPEILSPVLDIHPLNAQTSSLSPRGLPPLHLLIEDLRWGGLKLGRARLEAHAGIDGMEIEMIDISGADLRLVGRGRWVEHEGRSNSEFNGRLTTENLTGLLRSAGYESGIEASQARIDAAVRWPGAPVDFTLSRLSGSLELRMTDGTIPEARPGAGRLLGLASFTAIPRRLMLDFRDVFGAGLKFDEINGRFDLAAGFARTDGLVIRSPAANITISGDTDMAARQYDQTIVVEPGLGATLPVIGVLAGGPVGAAAGLVLRSILDRPLRGISEVRYSVTGDWQDPQIELVEARVTDETGEQAVVSPPDD